jgi:hypothetical protein
MPFNYLVTDDGKFVVKKWTGQISNSELINYERDFLKNMKIRPGAHTLYDCRSAVFFETTSQDFKKLIDLYSSYPGVMNLSKIALLLNGENFPNMQSVEAHLRKFPVITIAFSNFDVACVWLGVNSGKTRDKLNSLDRLHSAD